MAWEPFWTLEPLTDWERNIEPLQSRLLRFTYFGDALWLRRNYPRLFLRIHLEETGNFYNWYTLFPQHEDRDLVLLKGFPSFTHLLEVRKSEASDSINTSYTIQIEQFVSEEYSFNISSQFDGGVY